MNTDKKISRREALKRMGFAVMSSAIASSGLLSLASCETKRSKRIIFYFTGTGNSLYIARQLAGENAELLSIPQMVKRGKYELRQMKSASFIPSTVICLPIWYGSSFRKQN